ncbi:AraC family transcriptional regulator [Marinomonas colpomeniae]|uniref:Helix-turn-helix transcriptional regulator n=1 Tax=Marinomonas colpomeniae TaxID=2774408 RepID=A0ABR8P230_9GAMM|nr:helix-turn-helix transcriptional regulator [Marinomonas colpomeniae]MBD5772343.1 helix-turn-helix transcriptional regulator [Marinomonas colpomeniae]
MHYQYDQWQTLTPPDMVTLPRPVYFRSNTIPEKTRYPTHKHDWHQLIYASSGILIVDFNQQSFIITPEQAILIPAHTEHSTRSYSGAVFRSLYIESNISLLSNLTTKLSKIILVSPLLRELINKAASFDTNYQETSYENRIIQILLEEMIQMPEAGLLLPWPHSKKLQIMCEALRQEPADNKNLVQWAQQLGTSSRTLTRYFEAEMGISHREWRRRLKLIKALEYFAEGDSVTRVSLRLGYRSTSAFIYVFKEEYKTSPLQFLKENGIRV